VRLIRRSSSEQHGPLDSFTQRPNQTDRLAGGLSSPTSERPTAPSLQQPQSAAPSLTQWEILKSLREEAQQRLILQTELLHAEHKNLETSLQFEALTAELEATKRERSVVEERGERLAATLSMLEAKNAKLGADCAGLRDSLQRAESSRDQVVMEKVMEREAELTRLKEQVATLEAQLMEACKEREISSQSQALVIQELQDSLMMERENRVELEKKNLLDLVNDLTVQLREVSLDRGIIEGNLRSAVKQSAEMMRLRDLSNKAREEALALSSDAVRAKEEAEEKASELAVKLSNAMETLNGSMVREKIMQGALTELSRKAEANERYILSLSKARSMSLRLKPESSVGFSNANRFHVSDSDLLSFMRCIAIRSESFSSVHGFLGMVVQPDGDGRRGVYYVATSWDEAKSFERWSQTRDARKLEPYPEGVLQFVPVKGEGVPEDGVGYKDLGK
jgi:heme-degrading monooxygenase HmoA